MFYEFIKFVIYSSLIVLISKYILVFVIRKLAENLHLKPKTVGNIAGYATSIPELLTIVTSSTKGLIGASIYNILSSNVINFIQYIASIYINKNNRVLKNKAIRIDIILVIITIIIPIVLIIAKISIDINIVPIFILLYILFIYINNKAHKIYLNKEDKELENIIYNEEKQEAGNKTLVYIFELIVTGILLFVIGEMLGNTLENLANIFNISQTIIGILLGFITSIPELITFFESQKHHKQSDEILGVIEATNNLLSSNIINLFLIQSIGVLIFMLI